MEKVKPRNKSLDTSSKKGVISDFHHQSQKPTGHEKSVNRRYASASSDSGVCLRNSSKLKVDPPPQLSVSEPDETHVVTTRSNSFRSSTLAKRARIVHVTRTRRSRSTKIRNNNDQSKNAEFYESQHSHQNSAQLQPSPEKQKTPEPDIKMEPIQNPPSPPLNQDNSSNSSQSLQQPGKGSHPDSSRSETLQNGLLRPGPAEDIRPNVNPRAENDLEVSVKAEIQTTTSSQSVDEKEDAKEVKDSSDEHTVDVLKNPFPEESPPSPAWKDGSSPSRVIIPTIRSRSSGKKGSHVSEPINSSPLNGLEIGDESILSKVPVPTIKSTSLKPLTPAKQNIEKMRMAPMLFMNNLPYMGELTFDTRPRRGRKPKKADICHLISKNYGIQFPNSYVNIPVSSPTPRVSTPSEPHPSSLNLANISVFPVSGTNRVDSISGSGGKSAKNKLHSSQPNPRHHCYNSPPDPLNRLTPSPYTAESHVRPCSKAQKSANPNHNNHQTTQRQSVVKGQSNIASSKKSKPSRIPQNDPSHPLTMTPANMTWPHNQIPPDLLPLASSNPSFFFQLKSRSQSAYSNSSQNHAFKRISMLRPTSRRSYALPDLSIPGTDPDEDEDEDTQDESSSRPRRSNSQSAKSLSVLGPAVDDEPLNLCLRDKDLYSSHITQLNLLSQTPNLRTIKPSANNLFNSFNLKRNNKNSKMTPSATTNVARRGKSFRSTTPELPPQSNLSPDIPKSNKLHTSSNLMHKSNKLRVNNETDLVNFNIHLSGGPTKLSNFSGRSAQPFPENSPHSSNQQQTFSITQDHRLSPPSQHATMNGRIVKGRPKRASPAVTNEKRSKYPQTSLNTNREEYNTDHPSPYTKDAKSLHKIPPSETYPTNMQVSQANAAEVSICKFKFTGGAKPSLQEKKMLSVDATGNFRFYSDKGSPSNQATALKAAASYNSIYGTNNVISPSNTHQILTGFKDDPWGAKSEFLPSIPLSMVSSRGGKPLSATFPSPSLPNLSNRSILSDIQSQPQPLFSPLLLQDSPGDPDCSSSSEGAASSSPFPMGLEDSPLALPRSFDAPSPDHYALDNPSSGRSTTSNRAKMKRKRRTRKSLMREKLEKTFKEKGFLIQTQQLESAEGATYCKFRQLRKFTRYLFRSWKDYLPDNLQKIGPNAPLPQALPQSDGDLPIPPAPPSLRSDASENLEMDQDSNDNQCSDDDSPDDMTTTPSPNQPASPLDPPNGDHLLDFEDGDA